MTYHICPICDQKLKNPHYCSNCRQRIKNPLTIDVDYYLNERHPDTEHDCSYHDYSDMPGYSSSHAGTSAQTSGNSRANGSSRGRSSAGQTGSSARNTPSRPSGGTSSGAARSSSPGSARQSKNPIRGIAVILIIFIVILSLVSTFSVLWQEIKREFEADLYDLSSSLNFSGSSNEFLSDLADNLGFSGTSETVAAPSGSGYEPYEYEPEEYKTWDLEDEAVIAAGENCIFYGHFHMNTQQIEDSVADCLSEMGYVILDQAAFSHNSEDNYGYSRYNTYHTYLISDNNTIEFISDTATGQLHSFMFAWNDEESLISILRNTLSFLRETDDWPLTAEDTDRWLEEVLERMPETDYETITPEGAPDNMDVTLSSDEYGAYYVSVTLYGF